MVIWNSNTISHALQKRAKFCDYRCGASGKELEEYLRFSVYKFGYKDDKNDPHYDQIFGGDRKAGGTLEEFEKN